MRLALVILAALPLAAQVKLTQASDRIVIDIDGKPFTTFFIGGEAPKPYLHPLRTATGKIVTRAYPMESVEGEPRDHPHHRGLWFTHGDVNGIDFWMNEASYQSRTNKGKIALRKVEPVESGAKTGKVGAIFEWSDPSGKLLLTENRTTVFHSHPTLRIIDFDIQLTAKEAVKFGDTKEGTFALRLKPSLQEEKGTGKMVNAAGAEGEKNVWGKQSPWVDYYGQLEGETVGVAIMDHPTNPKHPTYWHSRAYGLFAANPFGEHDFLRDKNKDGSISVAPGQTLRFRYRVVIHPGNAQTAGIADLYSEFAKEK